MHNVQLNPFYVINNIIFVNIKKHYVYIERSAWETVHRVVFGSRRSSVEQRKQLRKLFFDTYCSHVYKNETIYPMDFNLRIEEIKWGLSIYEDSKVDTGTTLIYSETVQPIEGYIDDSKKLGNKEVSLSLNHYGKVIEDVEIRDKLILFLNTMISTSSEFKLLIEYIGFNRCIGMLNRFLVEESYSFGSDFEGELLSLFISYGFPGIRFKMVGREFDFICNDCKCVGKHFNRKVPSHVALKTLPHCYQGFVRWFVPSGYLQLHWGSEDLVIDKSLSLRDSYVTDDRINGYHDLTSCRIGLYHVNQSSSETHEEILIRNWTTIFLDDFFRKCSFDYKKSKLHRFNCSKESIDVMNGYILDFENALNCDSLSVLLSSYDELLRLYLIISDFYKSVRGDDDAEGFASVNSSKRSTLIEDFRSLGSRSTTSTFGSFSSDNSRLKNLSFKN